VQRRELVVARPGDEAVKIMNTPEIQERARAQGFRVDARGPDAFAAFLAGSWRCPAASSRRYGIDACAPLPVTLAAAAA
jgi:hypothetical protein